MGNLAITYQHIANILSFKTSDFQLEEELSNPSFDWDSIVVEGSKHLVLPTIYCRLKSRELLHVLPLELKDYLEEITSINRNRNLAIISQIKSISKLLNGNKINYVFLKGAALLVLDIYSDVAERMVGDIDILISRKDINLANTILQEHKYLPIEQTIGNQFFEHKHLPRLKPKNEICAVELHQKLFISYTDKNLKVDSILREKITITNINIPTTMHLLMHNILNFQINDKGALYNSISFRSAYDTIVLIQKENDIRFLCQTNIYKKFFRLNSLFLDDIKIEPTIKPNFQTSFYLYKLNHLKFYKNWNRILNIMNLIPVLFRRLILFLINSTYRKAIINDRKRIFYYFKTIFYDF